MASTLCDRNVGHGTVIWIDESEEWFTWYAEYEDEHQLQGLVEHFQYFYGRYGVIDDCDLPSSAQPVLKVMGSGEVMRFWTPPGPRLPEKHSVDVGGDIIVFHERCYTFDE